MRLMTLRALSISPHLGGVVLGFHDSGFGGLSGRCALLVGGGGLGGNVLGVAAHVDIEKKV